ncbi:NAD(P)H-binding protein [Streptomyces sp. MST-110588]|uniref:NmrA family NAD(P)-binding protein n=1 Tax=Streptomyces sp. MST-110588 TaxID=2833628 RepID=UPI001F5D17BB|nr:NAD(P)H-binding protein [Streptomyces sp. MST-110588]UNO39332.1 NAD(P)H-binding protein [Streptomyces sp. MST-110588]
MADKEILVLGGTGKTGRRVAQHVERRGAVARAASRSGRVRFDWYDESTWPAAVEGACAAYIVDSQQLDAVARMRAFTQFAVPRGVRKLVLLSARGVTAVPQELNVEGPVRESGADWTILRPSWFAQGFSEDAYLRDPVIGGELRLPAGDGRSPFIDAEDIAEVAAVALTEDGHEGQLYELSGSRSMTFGEAVEEIARATGRDIRYVPVSGEEYVRLLTGQGAPAELAEALATWMGVVRDGLDAHLSDGVRRVLGREPRDFTDFVKRTAAVWAAEESAGE